MPTHRLALLALFCLPIMAQTPPVSDQLCSDGIPGTNGFGNLRRCNELRIFAGSTPPTSLDGVDGALYLYMSGTVTCLIGPRKAGIWPAGCMQMGAQGPPGPQGPVGATGPAGPPGTGSASLPLVPCSSIALPPQGTTVLVVTNAAVGTSAAQIGQAQCLAGFRVVTLDGIPIAPTADKSPHLLRQLNTVMADLQGAGYASWAVKTLRADQ